MDTLGGPKDPGERADFLKQTHDALRATAEHKAGWLRKHGQPDEDYEDRVTAANAVADQARIEFDATIAGEPTGVPSGYQIRKYEAAIKEYLDGTALNLEDTEYDVNEDL